MDLRKQLEDALRGSTCVIGLGNTEYGDDGFGMHLAAQLIAAGLPHVVTAGNAPERYLGRAADSNFDRVLFLDAVDVGAEPGSAVLLNSDEMSSRFPQVSTHKISLGLLAKWAEENGVGEVWLLGVQPESIRPGDKVTPKLEATLEIVADVLQDILLKSATAPRTRGSGAGVTS